MFAVAPLILVLFKLLSTSKIWWQQSLPIVVHLHNATPEEITFASGDGTFRRLPPRGQTTVEIEVSKMGLPVNVIEIGSSSDLQRFRILPRVDRGVYVNCQVTTSGVLWSGDDALPPILKETARVGKAFRGDQ